MKKPGSSSSKAVPRFLHIKGIPHAASPCFCALDVPPRPQGLLGFVCLFGFGFPLPSTGPALTAPRQLSQGSSPSSPLLSHTATCLCHFSFCPSHRQVTVLSSPANPIHPSLRSPPVLVSLKKGRWSHILTWLLHAPPPEIFPLRNSRVPSPDPSFAPVAADTIS